jgi:hypothetical protein
MGTDYSIACVECKLFIDLHKWPVIDELAYALTKSYQQKTPKNINPGISNYPFAYFNCQMGLKILKTVHKEKFYSEIYIKKLTPALKKFLKEHLDHTIIMTCDLGPEPWDMSEPCWFQWKEVIAAFDFNARFLPRNLIDDFKFKSWNEVIAYYEKHEWWFLHDQMAEQREELRKRFNELK